jgi:hypothetical protein
MVVGFASYVLDNSIISCYLVPARGDDFGEGSLGKACKQVLYCGQGEAGMLL